MAERTFTFREGWKEAIKALPDGVRLEIYDAIVAYAFGEEIEGLKPMTEIVLNFVKPAIEEEFRRKESIAERNRRNGSKHVAQKAAESKEDLPKESAIEQKPIEPSRTQSNPNNPLAFLASQERRKEPKEERYLLSVSKETDARIIENNNTRARADRIDWKWLREQLVLIFQGSNIPKPNAIFSEGRKKNIKARIDDVGIDRFLETMKKAANSTFLSNGKFSLSWLVNPQNFEKLSEGVYDDKPSDVQRYVDEKTRQYHIAWESVVKWFNNCGLIPISVLTDERKHLFLKAYELVGGGKAEKDAALKKFKAEVSASDYLQGKAANSKKRDFDWCFDRMNYLRILEGTYNNSTYNSKELSHGNIGQDARSATDTPERTDEEYRQGFLFARQ